MGGVGILKYHRVFTGDFQLSKSHLMHPINLFFVIVVLTPPLISPCDLASLSHAMCRAPCQDSWNPWNAKTKYNKIQRWGHFKTRRGHGACFAFSLWGDLKSYVLCYPSVDPLIIVMQVMLKFLSKLGKGLCACKTYCFMGMNQPCDSF